MMFLNAFFDRAAPLPNNEQVRFGLLPASLWQDASARWLDASASSDCPSRANAAPRPAKRPGSSGPDA
jgi:hypothetical protein